MLRRCRNITFLLVLSLLATATFAQSPATQPNTDQNKKVAEESKPADLQTEITTLKVENAAGSRTAAQGHEWLGTDDSDGIAF